MKELLKKIKCINNAYTRYKWREQKKSYGNEHENKTFYVIRRAPAKVGLFSLVMTTLGYIKYAIDKGYIPVVDIWDKEGNNNIWELYFEQPCGYSMKDVCRSKKVILGNGIVNNAVSYPGASIAYNIDELRMWKALAKRYLIIKTSILDATEILGSNVFSETDILGVLLRGTDYINARPPKHPVQPNIEMAGRKIDEVCEKFHCKKIYLVTEDRNIYEYFKQRYGDRIVSLDTKRYVTNENQNINDIRNDDISDKAFADRQYLISILLLARCNYLVAGNAGGTQGALLLNEKYDYQYIFNLGVYEKE